MGIYDCILEYELGKRIITSRERQRYARVKQLMHSQHLHFAEISGEIFD